MSTEKKNSKYFLNLEMRNFLRKKISKLKLSNGEETDDVKTMLEEEKTFYKNLYSTRNVNPNNSEFDAFFNNNLLTPLNEDQSKKCEGFLTEQECYQVKPHGQWKEPRLRRLHKRILQILLGLR